MNKPTPKVALWFAAAFTLFFGRAFIFSTWVSRGPEVKDLLSLNTFQMGIVTMLYPLGGLLAIGFGSALIQRFGSRAVAATIYIIASASMALLGVAINSGNIWLSSLLLVIVGSQMSLADYVANYEGNLADKASKHSLFSAIHGAFGLGMMLAAALAGALSNAEIGLGVNYLVVALVSGISSVIAAISLPRHEKVIESAEEVAKLKFQRKRVWREKRSITIAYVGFAFIMAEMAAGTWVPIALTDSGFSSAGAAFALSIFWVAVTIARLTGGFAIDAIGRFRVVQISGVLTTLGIAIFMLQNVIALPYLGLIFWGIGMALGFPMSVSTMGDDPAWSAARINMAVTIVYLASITVGPTLGTVGQAFGIYISFGIPLIVMAIATKLSTVTKPLS